MEIYIIRHTKLKIDQNICYGQSEVALADSFPEELEQLHLKIPLTFEAVYTSPLIRCKQLAMTFSENTIIDHRLLEMNFGDWEMKMWNDIDSYFLNNWMEDFVNVAPPRGENLSTLALRVNEFMEMLRKQAHTNILVVTHAGVIRCMWAYLLEIPLKNIFKIPVSYHEVFHIRIGKNRLQDQIVIK